MHRRSAVGRLAATVAGLSLREASTSRRSTTIRVNGVLVPYEVLCRDPALPPAEPTCTLTGGNRQFHPTQ